jgi:AmmeMemoRadiSam system protein B
MAEHSAEVQLPFLLHRNPDVRIAVVTVAWFRLGERERVDRLQDFGRAVGRAVRAAGGPVLCVASSDMSHVGAAFSQPPPDGQTADAFARDQDRAALEPYLALDTVRFPRVIRERGITMCGWAPALVALCAALEQGAMKARLVRYATSAEVSGDVHHVVGYAGIVVA